jgi:hypothetical protein
VKITFQRIVLEILAYIVEIKVASDAVVLKRDVQKITIETVTYHVVTKVVKNSVTVKIVSYLVVVYLVIDYLVGSCSYTGFTSHVVPNTFCANGVAIEWGVEQGIVTEPHADVVLIKIANDIVASESVGNFVFVH